MQEPRSTKSAKLAEAKEAKPAKLNPELPVEASAYFDLRENMEGVIPRLPQISILHQGKKFQFPDDTTKDRFKGVIIDTHPVNAYWEKSFQESGGGTPPDCYSLDGIKPSPLAPAPQSDYCATCPWNKYGTDGRGKKCKNMRRLHILFEGEMLPKRLTLPPSSLKSYDTFATMLTDKGIPYPLAIVEFWLKEAQNKDGIKYAEVQFNLIDIIKDPEGIEKIHAIRTQYKEAMRQQEVLTEEYAPEEETKAAVSETPEEEEVPF